MIDPKKLEEIAKQVHNSLPPGIRSMGEEAEKKMRQVLQAQLGKLDLVSREEFDVQTKVLLRTREKLAASKASWLSSNSSSAPKTNKQNPSLAGVLLGVVPVTRHHTWSRCQARLPRALALYMALSATSSACRKVSGAPSHSAMPILKPTRCGLPGLGT